MKAASDMVMLETVMDRFNNEYFICSLGEYGFFCMPNFLFRARNGVLEIQFLDHVSPTDEAAIRQRLDGLSYDILSERLTLASIEDQSGHHFPNVDKE